ncbi:hypothetical protein [Paremcibacter congregatus]
MRASLVVEGGSQGIMDAAGVKARSFPEMGVFGAQARARVVINTG